MRWCEENGRGFDVGVGIVPIIPGAVLFDLPVGDYKSRPTADMGYKACVNASRTESRCGNIGAGTGATIGKALGMGNVMKGGLGTASLILDEVVIGALVAVNCFGDIIDQTNGKIIAGVRNNDGTGFADTIQIYKDSIAKGVNPLSSNTTIGVIATNAKLSKPQATKVSKMTHDGYARSIKPIHTLHDGDTVFTLSTGDITADISILGTLAAEVMSLAIVRAVKAAKTAFGIPGFAG